MRQTTKMLTIKVTEEEEELIAAIRNYVNSYPNGSPQLRWYAEEKFNIMMDCPGE